MSKLNPQSPSQPLSIGNVVSTGVRLYRSHLKDYLKLSAIANLWGLAPFLVIFALAAVMIPMGAGLNLLLVSPIGIGLLIFAFAKYYGYSAVIARLAFAEMAGQPETVKMASDKILPRQWSFTGLAFLVGLYIVLLYIGLAFVGALATGLLTVILGAVIGRQFLAIVSGLLVFVLVLSIIFGLIWFFSRWFVAEMPLAVEEGMTVNRSLSRSWELTNKSVLRIQAIVFIAFLVTLPLLLITTYVPSFFVGTFDPQTSIYWIAYAFSMIRSIIGSALVLPFWQTTKAVLYYDLRSRKEGLGLKLRDHNI
ncbi:hypothetical protein NG798_12695 [Ancylothrix sp. C2]|uniref:hypothetical protein n=1 Tax=Ancylothrix sp. D3o TaxID=2953691 RepID=UPI0021BBA98C|nr:hypothetical protein [Ancylothrix sp. D3o]MCT7950652.1 hypothetical protein [Ancylothrix sp. D3o]